MTRLKDKKDKQVDEGLLDTKVGSYWFNRLVDDAKKISSDIKFKRIKHGFYRIYWTGCGYPAYIGECYKEMPEIGYNINDTDIFFESKKYFEEFEDSATLTRKIKNFVEGYWEMLDHLKTRMYMIRNNKQYRDMAIKRYKTLVIK